MLHIYRWISQVDALKLKRASYKSEIKYRERYSYLVSTYMYSPKTMYAMNVWIKKGKKCVVVLFGALNRREGGICTNTPQFLCYTRYSIISTQWLYRLECLARFGWLDIISKKELSTYFQSLMYLAKLHIRVRTT